MEHNLTNLTEPRYSRLSKINGLLKTYIPVLFRSSNTSKKMKLHYNLLTKGLDIKLVSQSVSQSNTQNAKKQIILLPLSGHAHLAEPRG